MTTDRETIRQAAEIAAPVFAEQEWTWWNTYPFPPEISQIEECIESCYEKAAQMPIEKGEVSCSTGRICVTRTVDEAGNPPYFHITLWLGFIYEEENGVMVGDAS